MYYSITIKLFDIVTAAWLASPEFESPGRSKSLTYGTERQGCQHSQCSIEQCWVLVPGKYYLVEVVIPGLLAGKQGRCSIFQVTSSR